MLELARRKKVSRNPIRLWIQKYEAGELPDDVADALRVAELNMKSPNRSAKSEN